MLVHPKGCPQSFFTSFPQRVAVRYQYNWLLRDVVEQSSSFSKRDVSDHFRSKIRCICDKHQTTSPPNEITRSELNFCQCISSILQHYTLKLSQTSTFSLVPVLWNDCERDRGPPGALQGTGTRETLATRLSQTTDTYSCHGSSSSLSTQV